jgi:hypothetical protein
LPLTWCRNLGKECKLSVLFSSSLEPDPVLPHEVIEIKVACLYGVFYHFVDDLHLIFNIALTDKDYCFSHSTDDDTKAQRGYDCPKLHAYRLEERR